MKRRRLCLILLIVSSWTAAGQNETGFILDSLAPAVKYGYRSERRTSGVFHTDMKELRTKAWSPVGENDPIRFAMTLPGVSSGADGFSAFFARGGNLGNNLVTLDGVRIYGYSHLLGLTTALSPDDISSMDFCIGGFSGDQGNMTASHIRLLSPDSDYARFRSSLSASNTFVGASVSVPVVKDRVSVFAAGRYSPFGLEYRALKSIAGKAAGLPDISPRVGDLFVKAGIRISARQHAFVSLFGSEDNNGIDYRNTSYQLGWRNAIGHAGYRYAGTITEAGVDASFNYFKNWQTHRSAMNGHESTLKLQSAIQEWSYSIDARHTFADGMISVAEGIRVQHGLSAIGSEKITDYETVPFKENIKQPLTTSLWLEVSFNWRDRIQLMANIRRNWYNSHAGQEWDWYRYKGAHNEWSARASFTLCRYFGLEATCDHRVQFLHTLEGTPLGWSVDLMVPPTAMTPPERSRQYYAGLFSSFAHSSLTLGAYYKKMQNLVYYVDAMSMFTLAAANWDSNVRVGNGTSYGAELHYEIHAGRLEGALSYTWSKTDRQFDSVNLGKPFPAKFDRRHILNANATVTLSQGGRTEHCLTLSTCLQSGHLETISSGTFTVLLPGGESYPLDFYDHPDNFRMPLYFRIDTGYQVRFIGKYKSSLTLGVYNMLNRHNPSLLSYDSDSEKWFFVSFFPIMPNLKYQIDF